MVNNFIANIIWLIHFIIVMFVLTAPFINIPAILILHITFSISLLSHWVANSDVCSLTILESYFRGIPCKETFMNGIVGPMYTIPYYPITIILMCISIFNLYYNDKFQQFLITKDFTNLLII